MAATDDPIANLTAYVNEVENAKTELDKAEQAFKHYTETFQKVDDAFEQQVAQFNAHIADSTHTFETLAHEVITEVEHIGALAQTHADTNLTHVEHSVEESEKHLTDAAHTTKADVTQAHSDLQQHGFDTVEQAHHTVDEIHDNAHQENETHFGHFDGHVDNLDQQVEAHENHLQSAIQHASEEVTGNVTSIIETAFSTFSSALSDTHTSDLTQGVSEVHDALGHALEKFQEDASGVAQHLMESVEHSIGDIGSHIGETMTQAIQEAVTETIEKVIEDLIKDILESIVMMETGAAITAALSPILPELVIAKSICDIIDKLLHMLGGI
jgi:hypothetical protein